MLYDSQLEACLKPQTLPITTHVTKAISLFKILGISYFVCLFAYFCFAMFFSKIGFLYILGCPGPCFVDQAGL